MRENETQEVASKTILNIVKRIVLGLAVLCLALICIIGILLYVFRDWPNMARKGFTRSEAIELARLINGRLNKHAAAPINAKGGFILHLLEPDEMMHLRLDPSRRVSHTLTNSEGELLDGWATPYRIEFTVQSNLVIRSAGKNRTLGDKDDIVWWNP